jgi:2-hydroxycyclohexanecarboxyl-CoA dehydrogenase
MKIRPYAECSAVLTGSTSSIAFEAACQLAEAGVPRIMLNGRNEESGAAAVRKLRERAPDVDARFTAADPTRYAGAAALIDAAVKAFGAIDILVNSISGPKAPGVFHETKPEDIDTLLYAHLGSTFFTCLAAMPAMMAREGGAIINLSSDAGKIATPGEALIGGCKAGVIMFSRTLALEASRSGIRVNCITPSIVRDTQAYDRMMANEFSRALFQKAEKKARLGVVAPADIAPLIVFLAGPGAARLTGQAISVNGGISAA